MLDPMGSTSCVILVTVIEIQAFKGLLNKVIDGIPEKLLNQARLMLL